MRNLTTLDIVALILVVIGGLNWGLIGLFNFDLVAAIFGDMSGFSRVIYTLVGLSALYVAVMIPAWGRKEQYSRVQHQ
jgi:uncharacterized protein